MHSRNSVRVVCFAKPTWHLNVIPRDAWNLRIVQFSVVPNNMKTLRRKFVFSAAGSNEGHRPHRKLRPETMYMLLRFFNSIRRTAGNAWLAIRE